MSTKEMIHFEHNGVKYAMTEEQIDAAHSYRKHQLRLEDAERQLDILVFNDEEADPDDPENEQLKADFAEQYGISYEEAVAKPMLEKFVEKFEDDFDCNVNENGQWQNAIYAVLKGV